MTKIFPQLGSATPRTPFLSRLKADQKGGVYMIMGFAIIPLTFILGFGIDYARAMSLQTKLNAAADAAALAAVAPSMILQSNSQSRTAATNMFNAQASLETGYEDLVVTPVVTEGSSGSGGAGAVGYLRKATVSYRAKSINMFGGILGLDTLTVSGISSASAAQPPNVDFYLAMDNSPSMLLPATSDGITRIINATKNSTPGVSATHRPEGCAFACHMMVPHHKDDRIFIKDTQSREVLLSTGYYPAGPKQNVWYRYKRSGTPELFDSTGTTMHGSKKEKGATTTTGTGSNRVDKYTETETITKYTITKDDNTGPVDINQEVTKTPTNYTITYNKNGTVKDTTSVKGTANTTTTLYDTGYWADGYWLTHNYGKIYADGPSTIALRKDEVVSAASQLIPFATNQAAQYQVTYQAQMFSFDWISSTSRTTPVRQLNNMMNVSSYGSGYSVASIFPADDYWWKNSEPTKGKSNDDKATDVGGMLTEMNRVIPTAGTGAPGAVPQKILFIITDGMLDQPSGSDRYFGPMRDGANQENAKCTAIKARGIKIAILYTQYLPESLAGDSWSQTHVAPFLPALPARTRDQVLEALQRCASVGTNGAPLVQTVTANGNITTALQQLFSTALQTARLVQ